MKKNPYTVTNKDSLTVGRKEVGICLFLEYFFRLITLNYFPFPYPYTYKSDPYMTFFIIIHYVQIQRPILGN